MTAALPALAALAGTLYGAVALVLATLGLHALVLATVRMVLPKRPLPASNGPWPDLVIQLQ